MHPIRVSSLAYDNCSVIHELSVKNISSQKETTFYLNTSTSYGFVGYPCSLKSNFIGNSYYCKMKIVIVYEAYEHDTICVLIYYSVLQVR